jgi:hypothetical protein
MDWMVSCNIGNTNDNNISDNIKRITFSLGWIEWWVVILGFPAAVKGCKEADDFNRTPVNRGSLL